MEDRHHFLKMYTSLPTPYPKGTVSSRGGGGSTNSVRANADYMKETLGEAMPALFRTYNFYILLPSERLGAIMPNAPLKGYHNIVNQQFTRGPVHFPFKSLGRVH